ncbi:MAG: DNA methyltransferase [Patescibacteria group bacterium]
MAESFLILGSNPSISFAEMFHASGANPGLVSVFGPQAVIVDDEASGQRAPLVLGGVPKSGVIVDEVLGLDASRIASILKKHVRPDQKFHFGLSAYTISGSGINQSKLKALGLEAKRLLKEQGASVRLVESRSGNLSSVDVMKNKLVEKGVELCLFGIDGKFLVGRTQAVQPFEEYSERDYGRPGRDAKRGMLPPKLARIMINLSAAPEGSLILDPFCGSGTVLQEALLLGYRAIGTDIDEDAIRDTKKNIEWLVREHEEELPEPKIEAMDVRKLDETVTESSVDAIVTEVDLGPPLQGGETEGKVRSVEKSLSEFYAEASGLMRYALKPGSRAVIAWPYFVERGIMISAFEKLGELGFNVVEPYPAEFQKTYPLSKRGTLLYGRSGQHLFREIVILEKQ